MAFVPPKDRVFERSTSNSQSVFIVTGAADTSFNAFSASMAVSDTTLGAVVEAGVAFKSGLLTYSASSEVTVTTAYDSKGTFSSGGVKEVFMGPLAGAMSTVKGHLHGLTLSTAGTSTTFSVAAGEAADSLGFQRMLLPAAISKTTSSWAVGSGNGGLDTGTIAVNTWYHAYEIKRLDTGIVDALVSLSATSPTLPANYTLSRRLGSMRTNGSSQWSLFLQRGDTFLWDIPQATAWTSATSAALISLFLPSGVKVQPIMSFFTAAAGETVYISSPDTSDQAASNSVGLIRASATGQFPVAPGIWTNTSGQVRARGDTGGGADSFNVQGWIDDRGRAL